MAKDSLVVALISALLGGAGVGGIFIYLGDRIFPENHPPVAMLEVVPDTGPAPLTSKLNGNGSSDPDGETLETIWFVNQVKLESQEPVQDYKFSTPGQHIVTVEVRDQAGLLNRASKTVTVTDAFDLPGHLALVDSIKRVIARGELSFAKDLAAQGIENCDVAPPSRCAELYFQMGRVLIEQGDLADARQALAQATELKPDDLDHAVSFAEVLIKLNEYEAAVDHLNSFYEDHPTVWNIRYYLALAQALQRDYGDAQTGLEAVSNNSRRYAQRASFAYVLTSLLVAPGDIRSDHKKRVRDAVCGEPKLARLRANDPEPAEVDLLCFKRLAGSHLSNEDSTWLFKTMGEDECP